MLSEDALEGFSQLCLGMPQLAVVTATLVPRYCLQAMEDTVMALDLSQHTLLPWVKEPLVKVLGQQFGDLVCRVQDNRMGHACFQTVCVAQSRPDSGMTRQLLFGI